MAQGHAPSTGFTPANPQFFQTPAKFLRWSARQRPAWFWSILMGGVGFAMLPIVPPIRAYFGDGPRPRIPQSYPIPPGPRNIPSGYDD